MIKKVLIVDDSLFMRMVLKKFLSDRYDFEFTEAKDGLEALEKFKTFQPDLTFLDLTMPVMDGFQALDEMKKLHPDAVIIVATADVQEKVQVRVMKAGALTVLPKPPTKESVEAAVLKAMEVKIEV
ncbi:MAG: response regulator transcription factor [Nitrospiria bacterium]